MLIAGCYVYGSSSFYTTNIQYEPTIDKSTMKLFSYFTVLYAHPAGRESLIEWIEDPSYPNTTLSWNIIHGNKEDTLKYSSFIMRQIRLLIFVGSFHRRWCHPPGNFEL